MNTRRSRSSPTSWSISASTSGTPIAAQLRVLAFQPLAPTQAVEGAVLGRGHEPGARVVGHARLRPALEGDDERVLGQLLGHADIADDAREPSDEPGRLDPPDRLNRTMRLGHLHRCPV